MRRHYAAACLVLCTAAAGADAPALPAWCPSPEVVAAVAARARDKGDILLPIVAKELGVTEATIVQALPPQFRVAVPGSRFQEVWADLAGWDDAITAIFKGSMVFEIHGRVHAGEPSKKSNYFNLSPGAPGLSGHLRPDLVGMIAAVSRTVRGQEQNGVMFYDPAGNEVFGVYVPGEGASTDAKVKQQYLATRERLRTFGDPCARAAGS
jgi:putative heme utilization carrier protein HutX